MAKTWEDIKQEKFQPFDWNITSNDYTASGEVPVQAGMNAVSATNLGDTPVVFNGILLLPSSAPATILGDSVSISGNEGEVYKGKIRIAFQAPVGSNPKLQIVQKFYIAFQS